MQHSGNIIFDSMPYIPMQYSGKNYEDIIYSSNKITESPKQNDHFIQLIQWENMEMLRSNNFSIDNQNDQEQLMIQELDHQSCSLLPKADNMFLLDKDSDNNEPIEQQLQLSQQLWIQQNNVFWPQRICHSYSMNNISSNTQIPAMVDKQKIQDLKPQMNEQDPPKMLSQGKCQCKKSMCLKLYCDCFNNNQVCSRLCGCIDCGNRSLEAFQKNLDTFIISEEHHTASLEGSTHNSLNHIQPVSLKQNRKGCTCKKTACKKKYCECYSSGKACISSCKCYNCGNCEPQNKKIKM